MDETEPQLPGVTTPSLSRRDFLRRASKEAVDTGTKLVPGAAVARKVLGIDNLTASATDKNTQGLIQRLAAWRDRRRKSEE
jgi:hypothetical protein